MQEKGIMSPRKKKEKLKSRPRSYEKARHIVRSQWKGRGKGGIEKREGRHRRAVKNRMNVRRKTGRRPSMDTRRAGGRPVRPGHWVPKRLRGKEQKQKQRGMRKSLGARHVRGAEKLKNLLFPKGSPGISPVAGSGAGKPTPFKKSLLGVLHVDRGTQERKTLGVLNQDKVLKTMKNGVVWRKDLDSSAVKTRVGFRGGFWVRGVKSLKLKPPGQPTVQKLVWRPRPRVTPKESKALFRGEHQQQRRKSRRQFWS